MANSCEFKTSEASTKAHMRTEGLIDEYLVIKKLNDFRKYVSKWSAYITATMGIEGRLFSEKEFGDKRQAIPNKEMFKKIDNANGIYYQLDAQSTVDEEDVDVISQIEELQNFQLYENHNKLCPSGICNFTARRSTAKLKEAGLNPFPNEYGGDNLAVSVKGPLGGFNITHYVSAVAINDTIFIYDMPQQEFISNEFFGEGSNVTLKSTYKPRLIPLTVDSIKTNYDLTSEEAAKFVRSILSTRKSNVHPAFKDYIKSNIKNAEEYIQELENQITNENVILDSSVEWQQKYESEQAIADDRAEKIFKEDITSAQESKVINFLRNKLKAKTRPYLPTRTPNFVLRNLIKFVTGVYFDYDQSEGLDATLVKFDTFVKSEDFVRNVWQNYTNAKDAVENIQKSIDRLISTNQLLQGFFKIAGTIGIDQALAKYNERQQYQIRSILPSNLKEKYTSEKQMLYVLQKKYSNMDNLSKQLNIEMGKSLSDMFTMKMKANARLEKATTVLSYLNAVDFDASYISESISKEAKRRYAYFSEKGDTSFQLNEVKASKSSPQTIEKIKQAAQNMGINIQTLADYLKGNPNVSSKGVTGLADLIKGVVAVAQGKEEVALTEEIVHVATAILEQTNPKMITELISKIDRFKIYKAVLDVYGKRKEYQLPNGKPDIRKIKKEAVDKLIAEVIINQSENTTEFPELLQQENISMVQRWWNAIKDVIKGIYRKNTIDIFEEAAKQVVAGEVGDVSDITSIETYLQVTNTLVDDFYNKFKNMASKMTLVKEDLANNIKRHYTYEGKDVAKSVTEKTKASNKMPERTGIQKEHDDQKREWGNEGHEYMMNYINNNLIDKDGYKRDVFLNTPIVTKLNSLIQTQLQNFAKELINSYRPGTRFLIEEMVINLREKGMLASTIDFKAIEPTEDGKDIRIDTLDWKFMGLDKTNEDDIPWYKQRDWIPQMGEYTKIDREYGATSKQLRKARMIPFIVNYDYNVKGKPESGLYAASIEIGKLNSLTETNLYLLPVPGTIESTGVKEVDRLAQSLEQYYQKLAKKPVSPDEKASKKLQLKELSKAIRSLRLQLNFSQLSNVGITFLKSAAKAFKTFENLDYSTLTRDEIAKKLEQLLEFKTSAEKFTIVDDVFLAAHPKDTLNADGKKLLAELEDLSTSTGRMLNKIIELQNEYVVQLTLKEEIVSDEYKEQILTPEKEIKGLISTFTEASRLGSTLIKLVANTLLNARSLVNLKMRDKIQEYGEVLLPLEQLAKSQGRSAFDYIAKAENGRLSLIKKISKDFWEELSKQKLAKNKQFLLDNLNLEEYNALAKVEIEKRITEINLTRYSSDEEANQDRKDYEIKKVKETYDIESANFNGYTNSHFAYLFNRTMKVDKHYSKEFKEMMQIPEAYAVWKFFTALNERGIANGYLSHKGMSFFAMIEASMLQKLSSTNDVFAESKDMFHDLYKVRINETQNFSTIDPETNAPKKEIPKLFINTDKEVHQLSRDLTRVGTLWIKALMEYESARQMEDALLTIESVERNKGHLVVDERNIPIDENGELRVDKRTNKNADILMTMIDDAIYGLNEDLASIGSTATATLTEKLSKEGDPEQKRAASIKKGLEKMNMLTQSLAVGLKASIAIPNYFGNHFQSFINSGNLYKYGEFFKNHLKMITGVNLSTIEKGLIDMIVPLNGDPETELRRDLAFKQGYVKWLGSWNMQEFMMSTNYLPERNLQFTNALSIIDNSMVVNGKIVNIRQYLKAQERSRYKDMAESERRSFEKGFEQRVNELKEKSSLTKTAKVVNDRIVIPGVSEEQLAKFRTTIVEKGRELNGQMSEENKMGYRRDVMMKSLMMFRNWIPKQVSIRAHDISKNIETGDWEYGRSRLFMKTIVHLGMKNIMTMQDIMNGTDKGLAIMDEMLEQKRADYYKKTGKVLEITTEEFYDMVRRELSNEMKELAVLAGLLTVVLAAKAAVPDDDADDLTKNKYRYWAKIMNKISNEVDFYYNPISFVTMTKGSFLPALGLVTRAQKAFIALGKETYGYTFDDEKLMKDSHPTKYFLDLIPVISQFNKEILPLIDPELAKALGIRVTEQPRIQQ